MDEFAAKIEASEHQWMRSWMSGERGAMKSLTSRDFVFLLGSDRSVILDRASWLEAAGQRIRCESYRFNEIYVRKHGRVAMFATRITMEGRFGKHKWTGDGWMTDLWRRPRMRGKWKLVERVLSRPDSNADLHDEIRSMQLWR